MSARKMNYQSLTVEVKRARNGTFRWQLVQHPSGKVIARQNFSSPSRHAAHHAFRHMQQQLCDGAPLINDRPVTRSTQDDLFA